MPRRRVDPAGTAPNRPRPDGRRGAKARGLAAAGLALILLWVGVGAASVARAGLVGGRATWVPMLPMLAGDFKVHIDHAARLQAAGLDPYRQPGDWVSGLYPYPPMVARCFGWVVAFETATAATLWQGALGVVGAVGALAAARSRRDLGLAPVPRPLLVGALLVCTPMVFAAERGQSDPLVILPLIGVAALLSRGTARAAIAAGVLLGATAWLKYYPGLAACALLAPGRRKALAAFVATVAVVGALDFDGARESIRHGRILQAAGDAQRRPVHDATHSILENWRNLRVVRRSSVLRAVPPPLAAASLLLPAIALVGRRVAAARRPSALVLPHLLWLTAAATFALPYSNDYNLAPLAVAALATWDRRDRRPVHLAILAAARWWQPFRLPIGGDALLALKLAALYGVGASLALKASRPADAEAPTPGRGGASTRPGAWGFSGRRGARSRTPESSSGRSRGCAAGGRRPARSG